MISDADQIKSLSSRWTGPSFWAPAIGRRGGVAVLFSRDFRDKVSVWKKDSDGRILSILLKVDDLNINVVNLYAPTAPTERKTFLQSLHAYFFPHSRLIIGGDFNCYDNSSDKFGGNAVLSKDLSDLKSCFRLVDAWRVKHPRDRQFTWFDSSLSIASRLDTFLVSRDLSPHVQLCDILPCSFSDHDFVTLSVDLSNAARLGPGVWKLNNSLLNDADYNQSVRDLIDQYLRFQHVFVSIKEFWESLKSDLKLVSIDHSRDIRKNLSRERVQITNRLSVLKNRLVNGDESVKIEIMQLESAFQSLVDKEFEGAKIRSRAKWLEEGEAPTRFFFNLERQKHEKGFINSILNSDGVEVFTLPEITRAHEAFYADLFARSPIDSVTQRYLLSQVERRLSSADSDLCEGDLTLDEATDSLNRSSLGKTPGPDGLTLEFYLKFWDQLGPILVQVFNDCLQSSELCESMKTSVTRLVFKKGDKKSLKNWRPISLLNVDYKICSKALSLRLSKVLDSIVSPDQTCSVPGRSIASNLILLRDTLDYIERTNETGILVSLDQEKAFDRVDRSFLISLLKHFGFGPSFCNWIFTLYNGANMQVLVNDFLSSKIDLQRGVRQGDSLSPMLYILCVEVLACNIRTCPDIDGFLLPGSDGTFFKVGGYADDTTVIVKNFRSLQSLFRVISLYEKGTGAKLNLSKTEAMWLGAWKDRLDEPLGLTWVRKMKVLGIVFGTLNVDRDNWEPRLSKLDKSISLWKSRALSFLGRVLILNILGLSKLMYVSRVLVPPRWVSDRYNSLIWPFLWGSRLETVARKTIICPVKDGGLGLIDFTIKGKALRLASMISALGDPDVKCYFLARYFCGARLAHRRNDWAHLRDNHSPSAALPTSFYSRCLSTLDTLNSPANFVYSSKAVYSALLELKSTSPILPYYWSPFVGANFRLSQHWSLVRDSFTENFKNDLSWLITLRASKVRYSLRNWGYINSDICASCPRRETIDHCFLNCGRVKATWAHFLPLLSLLISTVFLANVPFVFFYQFVTCDVKHRKLVLYFIKSILFGVWKFRNKATFHNGKEDSRAIIKYITHDIKSRIRADRFRFSPDRFRSFWEHPAVCHLRDDDNLVFFF